MIGIDVVEIKRFAGLKKDDYGLWEKSFTEKEWDYCFNKANPSQSLSGIFASKEAVIKSLGGALVGRFNSVEVDHNKDGKPFVILHGKSDPAVDISISHDGGVAVAVAIQKI